MAFNPGGLTFYGGFLFAAFSIYVYGRKKGIPFFTIGDAIAPGMMLGYGIARLGCHLAGDGDYGFPTTLPWGTDYSNGTYPPSVAFKDFPEITSRFPGGIVPNNIPCHPTPVYEFIICALMCWFLWRIRKKITPVGKLFMIYLMLAGIERFAIEFLRPNPRIVFGLSEAQFIAIDSHCNRIVRLVEVHNSINSINSKIVPFQEDCNVFASKNIQIGNDTCFMNTTIEAAFLWTT